MTLRQLALVCCTHIEHTENDAPLEIIRDSEDAMLVAFDALSDEDKETFALLCDERIIEILG